jgi:hypothetical protein
VIVEERIYTLQPGMVPNYLVAYREHGLDVQRRHLGVMVGYFSTEFGPQNQIVHMWAYRDLSDREKRRKALGADPAWQRFRDVARPFLLWQENKLLIPADFSPDFLSMLETR